MSPAPSSETPAAPRRGLRRLSFTHWIAIWMLAGVAIGLLFPGQRPDTPGFDGADLKILSDLFVRGIKMIIGPILFATLVIGIAGHGDDLKRVGRLAFRSILYFEIVTTVALAVGLTAVNLVRPGDDPALQAALRAAEAQAPPTLAEPMGWQDHVRNIVPTSVFTAQRCTSRWRPCSSRRRPASSFRSGSSWA